MKTKSRVIRDLAFVGLIALAPAIALSQTPPSPAIPPPAAAAPAPSPAVVIAASTETQVVVIGSVVQLRSGSPSMTVVELAAGKATTQWHQGEGVFKKETFPVQALKIVDPEDDEDEEDEEDEDEDEE